MERICLEARSDWKSQAEEYGFTFHSPDGQPYWHEDHAYSLTMGEVDAIEDASNQLVSMTLTLVERVVSCDELLGKLQIPREYWAWIRKTWKEKEPSLYGRFDLAYNPGTKAIKLLEYNADTPTALYEAAVFQWCWIEQLIQLGRLPMEVDQFNGIEDALCEQMQKLKIQGVLHLGYITESEEDGGLIDYLCRIAEDLQITTKPIDINEIGLNEVGEFLDMQDLWIKNLFKLYPWEMILRDKFGPSVPDAGTRFIEPPWKCILSNKGILPLLWEMYPNHPLLLESYFADNTEHNMLKYVIKPIFSREGSNVTIIENGQIIVQTDDKQYGKEGSIIQAYAELPNFDGNYPVIGSWVVGETACGMGIREDSSLITSNFSRFVPHFISG